MINESAAKPTNKCQARNLCCQTGALTPAARCTGGSVAQWVGRWLVIERSRVRLPASPLPSNNSGQVVHTRVPLLPSSIIWYRPKGSDALQPGR